MLDLLNTYDISEIFVFLIIFCLAVKGIIDFYDWSKGRLKKVFDKEYIAEQSKEKVQDQIKELKEDLQEIKKLQKNNEESLKKLNTKTDLLMASDMDDIKSFITREHHYFCYQKKWIDDYSLNCIEKRYSHYKEEGGNSFIGGLMEEIRKLPKQPPEM